MPKVVVLLAAGLLVLGAACGGNQTAQPESSGDSTEHPTDSDAVHVDMTEFAFAAPATVPSGKFDVTVVNRGEQQHEMGVVPLKEGAPPVEELAKMGDKELQKWTAGPFGGTQGPIKPGEEKTFTLNAPDAASYAFACFVKDPETKKPHYQLGMLGSFEVEG